MLRLVLPDSYFLQSKRARFRDEVKDSLARQLGGLSGDLDHQARAKYSTRVDEASVPVERYVYVVSRAIASGVYAGGGGAIPHSRVYEAMATSIVDRSLNLAAVDAQIVYAARQGGINSFAKWSFRIRTALPAVILLVSLLASIFDWPEALNAVEAGSLAGGLTLIADMLAKFASDRDTSVDTFKDVLADAINHQKPRTGYRAVYTDSLRVLRDHLLRIVGDLGDDVHHDLGMVVGDVVGLPAGPDVEDDDGEFVDNLFS